MLEQDEFQSPDYDHLYKNVVWINYLLQGFLHVTLGHFKKYSLCSYRFYYNNTNNRSYTLQNLQIYAGGAINLIYDHVKNENQNSYLHFSRTRGESTLRIFGFGFAMYKIRADS